MPSQNRGRKFVGAERHPLNNSAVESNATIAQCLTSENQKPRASGWRTLCSVSSPFFLCGGCCGSTSCDGWAIPNPSDPLPVSTLGKRSLLVLWSCTISPQRLQQPSHNTAEGREDACTLKQLS
jgi:hypothetical protein